MPQLSGIYDSAHVQPIVEIKQNLTIWTQGKWQHYMVDYMEQIQPGPTSQVDLVVQAGATTVAANGTVAQQVATIMQLNENEFMQTRYEPIDNIGVQVWEQSGQQKFASRNIHSRCDRTTRQWDPNLSTTQFFIIGLNRDMQMAALNPTAYAIPAARVQFWGIRYILKLIDITKRSTEEKEKLASGDVATVRNIIGITTWLPAEGRRS